MFLTLFLSHEKLRKNSQKTPIHLELLYASKSWFRWKVMEQVSNAPTKDTGIQMWGCLDFSVQQEAQCLSWYHETGSGTQNQRNYRSQ